MQGRGSKSQKEKGAQGLSAAREEQLAWAEAPRLRGEDGGQGHGAKLREVAWTKFGDAPAGQGQGKGEARTAVREEAPR